MNPKKLNLTDAELEVLLTMLNFFKSEIFHADVKKSAEKLYWKIKDALYGRDIEKKCTKTN
jgi:hypothetical protein